MKRTVATLHTAAMFAVVATVTRAQTTCPVDPVSGFAVAQMISPTNGSTLPAGAVTFEWCNANADYFLTVESVVGAHDIFFAFAGGVGPGVGVTSVTLGPACAPAPPTGCIPTGGETIYVTLYTLKHGQILPPSPFHYTYTATTQPVAIPCVGDCNENGQVTVDELITLVNVALGDAEPSACPHGVPSGTEVDIALLLRAVNNALGRCSG
jgi:hypothetical protein